MQDTKTELGQSLVTQSLGGLTKGEWKIRMGELADHHGMFQPLGPRHLAAFMDFGNTLLVTFESIQDIRARSEDAQPLGFDMIAKQGWSHLGLFCDGETWFRDARVYGFFDHLSDDGFFDEFENVLFYGAGSCGYAAAAFSVACPGATVMCLQPQATLDPSLAEWDDRFKAYRRASFTERYGYAPRMLDAAEQAFVLYDPFQHLDAMHAALFDRPNVTRLRMRHMGAQLQTRMIGMDILHRVLVLAASGQLDARRFYALYRARRDDLDYLRTLMGLLDKADRPGLNAMLCRNVTRRHKAPRFSRKLNAL